MPATNHQVDRLSLTFRVEEPAPRSGLPGGWWIWCLLGIGVGLSGWLLSRQFLAEKLSEKLVSAKSRPEAMLALEGLLLLDSNASHAIVAGLQNEDFAVARAAFRAIEAQIERWQQLTPSQSKSRMQKLVQSLSELSDTTPSENRILASSLASRVFTLCLDRDEDDLMTIMQTCEQIMQRVSTAGISAEPDSRLASLSNASTAYSMSDTPPQSELISPQVSPEVSLQTPENSSEYTDTGRQISGYGNDGSVLQPELSTPPPPLPPDDAESGRRSPQLFDSMDSSSLPIDTSQPLSSTGGRASLRLIASPVSVSLSDEPESNSQIDSTAPNSNSSSDSDGEQASHTNSDSKDEQSAQSIAGMDRLPIQELVRLLASVRPKVAQAAALTLRRHGMTDSKLELAMQLATGSEASRLEIIDQFPTRSDIDPRVWLLWMAQDGEPEVRARSVAQLSSMLDNDVMRELRQLLNRERDPEIAQMIRRILMSR